METSDAKLTPRPQLQCSHDESITYRPICPSDEEQLRLLHVRLFPIDYEWQFYNRAVNGYDDVFGWVAVQRSNVGERQHDEIVGFITARLAPAEEADPQDRACMQLAGTNGQVIYLLTVGAHPDFQRQDIATDLMGLVHYRAIEQAARVLYLHVAAYNDVAIAFYTRCGFKRAALLKNFYLINSDRRPERSRTRYDALLLCRVVEERGRCQLIGWAYDYDLRTMLSMCVPWGFRRRNGLYLGHASACEAITTQTLQPSWLRRIFGSG